MNPKIHLCALTLGLSALSHAQDQATVNTSIGGDGTGKIVVEAHGEFPKPAVLYTASARADVNAGETRIEQSIHLDLQVIQGKAETISVGIKGDGEITAVESDQLQSWSVRQEGESRFLDLRLKDDVTTLTSIVKIRSAELKLPQSIDLTHLAPGKAIGFTSLVTIHYSAGIEGAVTRADGFLPVESNDDSDQFQTAIGGKLTLALNRGDASPAPVEFVDTSLKGEVHADGESCAFQLTGTARVQEPGAEITVLQGNAAVSRVPASANYRLQLTRIGEQTMYRLVFPTAGDFPVTLDFVAKLTQPKADWRGIDFTIAAGAVVPLTLTGLAPNLEFQRDQQSVVPLRVEDAWQGFLPATGHALLQWKPSRKTGEGKLFFTTDAFIEAKIGAGLLRQDHRIDYRVLQGELKSLTLRLRGPGEILDVQGTNLVTWSVAGEADGRTLTATLSQPITDSSQIQVRSQTPLDAFPVRVQGLRLIPDGAIRHSGYLRLTNQGSVRLEPSGLQGLTQLAPEQFPGDKIEARQVFVYRFPAADYDFAIAADRIQPEVNVSELVLYQLAETDRVINADVELDIREAPIREWDFDIPADYSVVSVTGAGVADYIVGSSETDGRRNLKVIFGQDVSGRQLVSLQLEKNEAAASGEWALPQLAYPEAKAVRGDIGIVGAPGFRIAIGATDLLTEKPLSYFPKPVPNLQQAFRIREPGWSATMQIERLEKSVQADVFHLYSLNEGAAYASVLINYFVTGAPVSEWSLTVPEALGNVMIDGQDVRTWRREGDVLTVALHQPVMGSYTLLVTFEEKLDIIEGMLSPGVVTPAGVQGERGFLQVVSPVQVKVEPVTVSQDLLKLDPLELPAEFRLLSAAPPLGTWQYTDRPFELLLKVNWFQPGATVTQVVEFSEASSRVSRDGELVTEIVYYVKSRGQRSLELRLPDAPVRLWAVSVAGQSVTARQAGDATLIPLPGGTDPNVPVEVRLRLGKPAVTRRSPVLTLPVVSAPVLKTEWHVRGDEKRILVPAGGTVDPPQPVLKPTGFTWVARRGTGALFWIVLMAGFGAWSVRRERGWLRGAGIGALAIAIITAFVTASAAGRQSGSVSPLDLSLPVLAPGETVRLIVRNLPLWQANLSVIGLIGILAGIGGIAQSFREEKGGGRRTTFRTLGALLIAVGTLVQRDGAAWFFGFAGVAILAILFVPAARDRGGDLRRRWQAWREARKEKKERKKSAPAGDTGAASASILIGAVALLPVLLPEAATAAETFQAADSIHQQWQIRSKDNRLEATGTLTLSGAPGDRFTLLQAPATLTKFEGEGLRLTKREVPGQGLTYILSIPAAEEKKSASDPFADPFAGQAEAEPPVAKSVDYKATFAFQLEAVDLAKGVPVLTGNAAVNEIDVRYDEAGWTVVSAGAVRITADEKAAGATHATVLLGPGNASIVLKPKERDVTAEATQFFVEGSNLYIPGPGVVDGRHRLHVRPSQGQVGELNLGVPAGLTVGNVTGPVGSWQFDADSGQLRVTVEPAQSQAFDVTIETQRGLDPLPADVSLAPLRVTGAAGEVGLVAIAFGPDAQPESASSDTMSAVNLGDFDAGLIPDPQNQTLHRVFRYGAEGGELALRVAEVAPEVRVASKQVLSLGDERVVLAVNFSAEISRAGLFQLSFPLPAGFEVESLTGGALHHWAELTEGDQRRIILHLNGKTLGTQTFSLTLTAAAPEEAGNWTIPRFEIVEATRQTGDLVVKPTTGIRLQTVDRQNVSETDPRTLGGEGRGALAFRLLQRDWSLTLGIEILDPWVTGQVLHEVTLREGQTRTALITNFTVQNASIRSLPVVLPVSAEDEIKTLRASGKAVSDLIRTAPDSDTWEIRFKRRVVGEVQLRIEYERRGERADDTEMLRVAEFPDARQVTYYFAIRSGGRLEIEPGELTQGWQRADWSAAPASLREAGNRNAPALTLRAIAPEAPLAIQARRHSLAEALKLRVAGGSLVTILSPTGDQLTAVDLNMEVIQRSSLTVGLPKGGELFSIFVNGESVHSIRQEDSWQFYILPQPDGRSASVRFVYTAPGKRLHSLDLISPRLSVPLENLQWQVIAPEGYELTGHDGDLRLRQTEVRQDFDRNSYLSKARENRQVQAQQAAQLLEQANQFLQAGEQTKARWALNSVANQYALDAASNEDARVQLENLQTQQAVVGLNTRRQRLYLDNTPDDAAFVENEQLEQGAASNPVLQQGQMNFRPQELSQLLQGNTSEDNAVLQQIAGRLVRHQRSTEPAPQAITITLPEEGPVYTFGRTVQVAENAPLELKLEFTQTRSLGFWRVMLVLVLLAGLAGLVCRRKLEAK